MYVIEMMHNRYGYGLWLVKEVVRNNQNDLETDIIEAELAAQAIGERHGFHAPLRLIEYNGPMVSEGDYISNPVINQVKPIAVFHPMWDADLGVTFMICRNHYYRASIKSDKGEGESPISLEHYDPENLNSLLSAVVYRFFNPQETIIITDKSFVVIDDMHPDLAPIEFRPEPVLSYRLVQIETNQNTQ